MKKNHFAIIGAVCMCAGMLIATGIEQNLWQGVIALVLMGAGVCAIRKWESADKPASSIQGFKSSTYRQAA